MVSIRKKVTALIVGATLSISAAVVGVDIVLTNNYAADNAKIMLNSACEARAQALDNRMQLVEQAVENIYLISETERPALDKLGDKELTDSYIDGFREMAVEIAENTEGAMTVYFRLNPELVNSGVTGFFYLRSVETGRFEAHETTDLYDFDPDDMEHVGWYYVPVRAGKPVWMDPYYNDNVDVDMISYVIPFYGEGRQLIGVVGIDVDFTDLVDISQDVQLYRSGGAQLLCVSNRTMYSNDRNGEYKQSPIPDPLYSKIMKGDSTEELIDGESMGMPYKLSYQTLSNHMKIVVYAPMKDINMQRNSMLLTGCLITFALMTVIMFFTLRMTERIIGPLKKITEATRKFAEGDWQVQIECNTNDELKILTDSIRVMADNTKNYIGEINDMAFRDALTGVKNKACYISFTEKLSSRMNNPDLRFGIVMMDVNGLKSVNDTLGHEAGDMLIKNASTLICRYFSHSPVFRTGGDEFVVIIEGEDYNNRDSILENFRNYMTVHSSDSAEEFSPSIASGVACFPEDSSDITEILKIADERMYENKVSMKGGARPR